MVDGGGVSSCHRNSLWEMFYETYGVLFLSCALGFESLCPPGSGGMSGGLEGEHPLKNIAIFGPYVPSVPSIHPSIQGELCGRWGK